MMRRILEIVFLVVFSIALIIFIFILIAEFVSSIAKDYQYAIIGALGSLIGGSLTLAGVWWTLRNQAKTDFVNEFPKKIKSLEELQNYIKSFRDGRLIFDGNYFGNKQVTYKQKVAEMKVITTEIDGTCYFIIGKMDNLYDEYHSEITKAKKFDPELHDQFGRPELTKESAEKLKEIEEIYKHKIDEIIIELENHSRYLTDLFFKYKGNK